MIFHYRKNQRKKYILLKPAIIPEVEKVVELKKSGVNFVGLCPFHTEDTPSFFIFKERFKCFGCGESGDVIDFVQKYYTLDFLQAIKHLEIKTEKVEYSRIKKKQELTNKFRAWEAGYFQELCMLIRVCKKLLKTKLTWKQRELMYHNLPLYEYHANIVQFGSDKQKYELYKDRFEQFDYKLDWSR